MENIVSAKNISFEYKGSQIINDVSFEVEKGDYMALVGHNGSGKTTLIKLILGILRPNQGEIKLFDKNIDKFRDWKNVGYLPQNIGLFNPLFPATVEEIISLGLLTNKTFPKNLNKEDKQKIKLAMETLNLKPISKKLIGELSGGQLQKTLLARAIVDSPNLLVLDEPVSSIDAETREEFFEYIAKLNKNEEKTIILITHDIGHAAKYTNKILFLDKKVVFFGDNEEFCKSSEMEKQFGKEAQHLICHRHK